MPLATTSNNAIIKRLGARLWRRIHYAVYLIAVLAVVHYWWLVKKDITQPAIYAAVFFLLLALRLFWKLRDVTQGRNAGDSKRRPIENQRALIAATDPVAVGGVDLYALGHDPEAQPQLVKRIARKLAESLRHQPDPRMQLGLGGQPHVVRSAPPSRNQPMLACRGH